MKKYLSMGMLALAIQANAAGLFYDFEGNSDDWFGRGDGEISLSSDQKHGGEQSLFVDKRTANWHGAAMSNDYLQAGKKYKISVYVFTNQYANMNLSLQYSDGENASYPCVAQTDVQANTWTELSGEIILPESATDIQPYVQSSNETLSFYIDDFSCEEIVEELVDHPEDPLKNFFNDYFKIGTAATQNEITPQNAKNLILHHFNSLTPGNELKPDCLLDQNSSIADGNNVNPQVKLPASTRAVLKFCEQNNLPIRGHVFVWHSQTPDWFFNEGFESNGASVSKEIMDLRMDNYIKNVVDVILSEFPNLQIYAWDVVNEVFTENGNMRNPGSNYVTDGTSRWVEIYGDDSFIYKAFTSARKYVPSSCKLYYNDYNEYIDTKRDAIYRLVGDLYAKGLCDGVGMQSHLSTSFPSVNMYRAAVEKYASIGCDIQVTELDITLADGADYTKQAQMYKDLFDIYRDYKESISLVAFWGTNDETSWRSDGKPLIFSEYRPKEAYSRIIEDMELSGNEDFSASLSDGSIYSDNDGQSVTFNCPGNFSYELTDLSGRIYLSGSGNNIVNLNLSSLPDGVYLAIAKTSNGKIAKEKMVKR